MGAVLMGLGARLEHPDLTPAQPSSAEQERQHLAILAQRIANGAATTSATTSAAASATASTASDSPLNSTLAADAEEWVTKLGGVWIPWPQGAPDGYSNPQLDLTGISSLADLSAALWEFSEAAQAFSAGDAAATGAQTPTQQEPPASADSDSNSTALPTLGLALALSATKHAVTVDHARNAPAACPSFTPTQMSTLLISHPYALWQLESARQALELKQANLDADQQPALTAAMDTLAHTVDAGLAAGASDVRPLLVPPPDSSTTAETIADSAVAALAPLAITPEETAALVSFQCQLSLDLTGYARATNDSASAE
ncbi:MAG: hypothetical protein PUK59_08195 [Actinomycetaceae bacterium]|nr:hypothetical protein [Actinomycetaceae bacterium]MDY5854785.1 hypothetical protein [Arcanobacterium sp.]